MANRLPGGGGGGSGASLFHQRNIGASPAASRSMMSMDVPANRVVQHPGQFRPYVRTQQNYANNMPVMMSGQLQVMYPTMIPTGNDSTGTTKFRCTAASTTPLAAGIAQQQLRCSQQPATVDPRQWYEEQQRLRDKHIKERNYQMQQHRLRQFQQASGNHSMDPDRFIQNMFGKVEPARKNKCLQNSKVVESLPIHHQEQAVTRPKARDWSQMSDLEDVFETTASEFPPWCQDGAHVPRLYADVERFVTRHGAIDTTLLYPVLLSSGLSRETLGHIWSLANRQTLGHLTKSELYAILAMVALAQNACQITSIRILHGVQQAPIPLLNQTGVSVTTSEPAPAPDPRLRTTPSDVAATQPQSDDDFDDFQSAASVPVPSSSSAASSNTFHTVTVTERLANHHTTTTTTEPDGGDFADFQQAFPLDSVTTANDIPVATTTTSTTIECSSTTSDRKSIGGGDLLIGDDDDDEEDKYNVFRVLAANTTTTAVEDDDFGDFLSSSATPEVSSVVVAAAHTPAASTSSKSTSDEDEFEFMSYVSRRPNCEALPAGADASDDLQDDAATGTRGALDDLLTLDPSKLEQQSVASLDLGTTAASAVTGSELPMSRCGSVPSLDLRSSDDESSPPPAEAVSSSNGLVVDRYSVIRDEKTAPGNGNTNESKWLSCLDSCHELLRNALNIFNGISSSGVCQEVIGSEEGEDYLKSKFPSPSIKVD